MKSLDSKVEALLSQSNWHEERKMLRAIILGRNLTEEVKWGKLCYTFQGGNVVAIFCLKPYCALGFFKGALLKDPAGVLVTPGEHSQAMRQIRFTGADRIQEMEPTLITYIDQAVEVEKSGMKVDFREKRELEYPDEFKNKLAELPELKEAFERLTPGRQRGYVLHFSGAKQSATRTSRIEKCIPGIMEGKGLNDR